MSKWAGKFVIGLTGNIGSGKSVVRQMLEKLGALGIDADALSHEALMEGSPGYEAVVHLFGRSILDRKKAINRKKLAEVVFNDPNGLQELEHIIHPLVEKGIDELIYASTQTVIVVEAIKLIESGLSQQCDSLWVTTASPEIQQYRLMKFRHMDEKDAQQRMRAQAAQEQKTKLADVVINNNGSLSTTRQVVREAWEKYVKIPGENG